MRSLIGGIRAKTPVPYTTRRAGGALTSTGLGSGGMTSQLAAMGSVSTLFAIADRIATAVAETEWHLYVKRRPGDDPDIPRREVLSHAAIDLWNRPNPFTYRQEFVEAFSQHLELTGETEWLVSYAGGLRLPLELWPIRPDRMTPNTHPTEYLTGWTYNSPDGEKVPLELDEVIQIKRPNALDPWRGMGPVQTLLADIDSVKYSAQWNRNFFRNSAEPGGIIEVDHELDDREWAQFTTRWREQHQGVAQAHRVAVIENGMKWVDRKFTQRDMQFSELARLPREFIREAFGMSKTMIGQSEDVNRATSQTAEYVFTRWTVVNRLNRIRGVLNTRLLPLYGGTAEGLEWDYDSPVPDDEEAENAERESKATAAEKLTGAGYHPDDVADVVGLPRMRWVGRPATPAGPGTVPTQRAHATSAAPDTAAILVRIEGNHAPLLFGTDVAPTAAAAPDLPEPPDGIPSTLPAQAGPDLTPVQEAWEEALQALLDALEDVTADQRADLLDQIGDLVAAGDLAGLASIRIDYGPAADKIEAALVALARDAARQVVDEADAQDVTVTAAPVDTGRLATIATVAAATLATGLAVSAVREALRVWAPTSTRQQVTDAVRDHLDSLTDAQPRLTLGGALSGAQHDGRMATITSGPSAALYADEVLDGNTCGPCRAVDRRWLGNQDDPGMPWLDTYPARGYIACLGRDRCRGQVVAVWRGGRDWRKWIEKEPVTP